MGKESLEEICMQLIAASGTAKSEFLEALQGKRKGDETASKEHMKAGQEAYLKAHESHAKLLGREEPFQSTLEQLLVMHSEDQMMAAETISALATEILACYDKIEELSKKENKN